MSGTQGSGQPSAGQRWTAILLAGDRPGGDPMARQLGQAHKALVDVAGRPMLAHVLATLLAHPRIGDVHVLAQDPQHLLAHPALAHHAADPRVKPAISDAGIAHSLAATLRGAALDWPVLVTTADHVLLDAAMIDWFIDHAGAGDVAVGMVNRQVVQAEGFNTARTWLKFRDVDVTGANLFALKSPAVFAALEYWKRLESHRKQPWRMAWQFGPVLLAQVLLRRLTLDQAVAAVGRKLGIAARAVQIPHARAGVDVDKLADHELVTQLLEQRPEQGGQ